MVEAFAENRTVKPSKVVVLHTPTMTHHCTIACLWQHVRSEQMLRWCFHSLSTAKPVGLCLCFKQNVACHIMHLSAGITLIICVKLKHCWMLLPRSRASASRHAQCKPAAADETDCTCLQTSRQVAEKLLGTQAVRNSHILGIDWSAIVGSLHANEYSAVEEIMADAQAACRAAAEIASEASGERIGKLKANGEQLVLTLHDSLQVIDRLLDRIRPACCISRSAVLHLLLQHAG